MLKINSGQQIGSGKEERQGLRRVMTDSIREVLDIMQTLITGHHMLVWGGQSLTHAIL